jgi:serine/threonine protein kinase
MTDQKNEYRLENKILGKGEFGTVHLGTIVKTNQNIALEEIPKNLDKDAEISLSNEMNISLSLDHTNIVKMINIIDINDKRYIAYEFCNGGDLRRYMQYFRKFDEELIQIISIKMTNGLMELHNKKVIYHDIKPEHILIQLFPYEDITPAIKKK